MYLLLLHNTNRIVPLLRTEQDNCARIGLAPESIQAFPLPLQTDPTHQLPRDIHSVEQPHEKFATVPALTLALWIESRVLADDTFGYDWN